MLMIVASVTAWSWLTLGVGQGLDTLSTIRATPAGGGYCAEQNPLYGGGSPSVARVVEVKATMIGVTAGLSLLADHLSKHHLIGNVVRFGIGVIGAEAGARNYYYIASGRCDAPLTATARQAVR